MRGKIGKMGMLSASSTSFLSQNFDRLDLPLAQVPKSARKRGLGEGGVVARGCVRAVFYCLESSYTVRKLHFTPNIRLIHTPFNAFYEVIAKICTDFTDFLRNERL
jgi:hypothetical protein